MRTSESPVPTWPSPNPEPYSTKDKILPGHGACIAYAESTDGVSWVQPKLGLIDYNGNRDNNIVFRGDLNGSTRGWHGGCVFIDPSSKDERFKMLIFAVHILEEATNRAMSEGGL